MESCLEREKNVETIRTAVKTSTGIFRGFIRNVTFLSVIALIPQRMKRARAPNTISSCLGKVKKSVVIVRKNAGNNRYITAIKMVAIDEIKPRADLLLISFG
jgi:hypothetical protein